MPSAIAASVIAEMIAPLRCLGVTSGLAPRASDLISPRASLHDRRGHERVVGHGRRQVRPLEGIGALPLLLLCRLAAACRRYHALEEDQVGVGAHATARQRPPVSL